MYRYRAILLCALLIAMLSACASSQNEQPRSTASSVSEIKSEMTTDNYSSKSENTDAVISGDTADGSTKQAKSTEKDVSEILEESVSEQEREEEDIMMELKIGDTPVNVEWENNDSVRALAQLCKDEPLTVGLSMYGGFEQVGYIGESLPRNDIGTTTSAGDIVLYSGDQVVVFYGSNSWAYTRLGHITDKSDDELAQLLGSGDVSVTFSQID